MLRYNKIGGKDLKGPISVDLSQKTFKDLPDNINKQTEDDNGYTEEQIIEAMSSMAATEEDSPDDFDNRGYPKTSALMDVLFEQTEIKAKISAEVRDELWAANFVSE